VRASATNSWRWARERGLRSARDEAVPALQKQFNYINRMQIRALSKIVVNIGLGEALTNPKRSDAAVGDLAASTGQHSVTTKAKRSIAQFRLAHRQHDRRAGDPALAIGCGTSWKG